jgi:preprotein translocase subunit SecG
MNYFIIFLIVVIPSAYFYRLNFTAGTILLIIAVVLAIMNKYKDTKLVRYIVNNYF